MGIKALTTVACLTLAFGTASRPYNGHNEAAAMRSLPAHFGVTTTEVGAKSYFKYPFLKSLTCMSATAFRGTKDGRLYEGVFCSSPMTTKEHIEMHTVDDKKPEITVEKSYYNPKAPTRWFH